MQTRIVVATDGRSEAAGALRLARALAERHGAPVEVVCAVAPFPFPASPVGDMGAIAISDLDQRAVDDTRKLIGERLAEIGPEVAAWPVTVEVGLPAPTLVRLAQARQATLIVLGLRRNKPLSDRLFGSETALQVMRLASVPVLAVPADVGELPRTAVAAVDFSDFSREAAEAVAGILAPDGSVHLAHVTGEPAPGTTWLAGPEWADSYRQGVELQLAELARKVEAADTVRVRTHLLSGDPAREILRLADNLGAELVAAGSHGTGFFGRLLLGSVSTRLVRGSACAVLIVPPNQVPAALEGIWGDAVGTESAPAAASAGRGS
jgi:nucleotide-binding universal stress UspA family protein